MGEIIRLVVLSVVTFPRLATSRSSRLRRGRVGRAYGIDQGGIYRVFRETVSNDGAPGEDTVLVVGFRLKVIGSNPVLHWLFQRLCILITPFWSGFRGFRVKPWMVDPRTKNYLGIYQWAGAAGAQTYVDALVKVLRPLSTHGSVWYELMPDQDLKSSLQPRER